MLLNSSKLIAKWTARYSGICWYFANSVVQSAADSGGTMPMTGFHSVIDSPDNVSRVTPPTTTIKKINPQHMKSHAAIGPSPSLAAALRVGSEFAIPAPELIKTRSSKPRTATLSAPEGGEGRVRWG